MANLFLDGSALSVAKRRTETTVVEKGFVVVQNGPLIDGLVLQPALLIPVGIGVTPC